MESEACTQVASKHATLHVQHASAADTETATHAGGRGIPDYKSLEGEEWLGEAPPRIQPNTVIVGRLVSPWQVDWIYIPAERLPSYQKDMAKLQDILVKKGFRVDLEVESASAAEPKERQLCGRLCIALKNSGTSMGDIFSIHTDEDRLMRLRVRSLEPPQISDSVHIVSGSGTSSSTREGPSRAEDDRDEVQGVETGFESPHITSVPREESEQTPELVDAQVLERGQPHSLGLADETGQSQAGNTEMLAGSLCEGQGSGRRVLRAARGSSDTKKGDKTRTPLSGDARGKKSSAKHAPVHVLQGAPPNSVLIRRPLSASDFHRIFVSCKLKEAFFGDQTEQVEYTVAVRDEKGKTWDLVVRLRHNKDRPEVHFVFRDFLLRSDANVGDVLIFSTDKRRRLRVSLEKEGGVTPANASVERPGKRRKTSHPESVGPSRHDKAKVLVARGSDRQGPGASSPTSLPRAKKANAEARSSLSEERGTQSSKDISKQVAQRVPTGIPPNEVFYKRVVTPRDRVRMFISRKLKATFFGDCSDKADVTMDIYDESGKLWHVRFCFRPSNTNPCYAYFVLKDYLDLYDVQDGDIIHLSTDKDGRVRVSHTTGDADSSGGSLQTIGGKKRKTSDPKSVGPSRHDKAKVLVARGSDRQGPGASSPTSLPRAKKANAEARSSLSGDRGTQSSKDICKQVAQRLPMGIPPNEVFYKKVVTPHDRFRMFVTRKLKATLFGDCSDKADVTLDIYDESGKLWDVRFCFRPNNTQPYYAYFVLKDYLDLYNVQDGDIIHLSTDKDGCVRVSHTTGDADSSGGSPQTIGDGKKAKRKRCEAAEPIRTPNRGTNEKLPLRVHSQKNRDIRAVKSVGASVDTKGSGSSRVPSGSPRGDCQGAKPESPKSALKAPPGLPRGQTFYEKVLIERDFTAIDIRSSMKVPFFGDLTEKADLNKAMLDGRGKVWDMLVRFRPSREVECRTYFIVKEYLKANDLQVGDTLTFMTDSRGRLRVSHKKGGVLTSAASTAACEELPRTIPVQCGRLRANFDTGTQMFILTNHSEVFKGCPSSAEVSMKGEGFASAAGLKDVQDWRSLVKTYFSGTKNMSLRAHIEAKCPSYEWAKAGPRRR
eukprot:jgi/Botrbrau1/22292/Bobra.0138s0044.1